MPTSLQVLILEDNPSDAELLLHELRRAGFDPEWQRVETEEEYLAALHPVLDIILSDYSLPQFDGLSALCLLRARNLNIPFILVSGTIGEEVAVECIRQGAADYLLKDRLTRLGPAVTSALEQKRLRDERKRAEETLADSEKRFRALIESAPDGISLLGVDGKIVYASPATQRILGFAPEAVIGTDPREYTHPDDLGPFLTLFNDLLQKPGGSFTTQYRFRHKDGSWRWLESTVSNLFAESWVKAIVFNYRDITERKQAEEALQQSEEKYRSIFENAVVGIYQTTLEGRYLMANPTLARILGYASPEALLQTVADLNRQFYVEPGHRAEFIRRLLAQGSVSDFESHVYRQDGSVMWISENARAVRDANDRLVGFEGTTVDITQRKHAEQEQARLSAILEATTDFVSLTDKDGRILYLGRGGRRIVGIGEDEDISNGRNGDYLTEPSRALFFKKAIPSAARDGVWSGETVLLSREGREIPVSQVVIAHKAPDGTVEFFSTVAREIRYPARWHPKPLRLLVTVAALILVAETLTMLFLLLLPPSSPQVYALLDGFLLTLMVLPMLYLLSYKPMVAHIVERGRMEEELRRYGEYLDALVEERTAELKTTNEQLRIEIDEHKRAEERLRESEAELRALFASMQDTVLVIDRAGIYRKTAPTNPAFWYILPQELLGKRLQDFFSAEQSEVFYGVMQQVLDTKQTTQIEYELIIGNQSVWYAASISPMDVDSTLWVARDITEQKQVEEVLQRNEALLLQTGKMAKVGGWELDLPTMTLLWSLETHRIHEVDPSFQPDLEHAINFYAPEARPIINEAVRRASEEGTPYDLELPFITAQGRPIWVRVIGQPEFRDGKCVRLFGAFQDITERKQFEEELRRHLAELEALHTVSTSLRTAQTRDEALSLLIDKTLAALDTDAGAIWLYDPEANELRTAVARGWFSDLSARTLKPGEGIAGKVFSTGQIHLSPDFSRDPQARPPRAGQIPLGWGGVCVPIRTGATTVGALFVSALSSRQITPEQVRLLESLAELAGITLHRIHLFQQTQEQARRVQAIMDTAATGMLLLDGDGRILLANPMAVHSLTVLDGVGSGQPLTRLGNRPLAELLLPPPQGGWHEVQAGGRTFEALARPMPDGDENRNWVLVLNDVTADREQQRYQQAQERLATVGQLAAGIAHDFNNIMGAIVLYTQMLRNSSGLSERQQRQLDTIHDQAQHAANLIRQILDFSRRSVMERAPLNLLPLVNELVKLLERTLLENIHLELAYDRSEYVVNGDPTRLQQALMNLAVNARDAMPAGGQLRFICSTLSLAPGQPPPLPDMAAGEWLCLAVADTGTGIAPEHLAHLFEPFFTTKEPGKGTGLGLAQVYGIVKQHDGAMDVRSQVGKGTTFFLYLPLLAAPGPLPASEPAAVSLPTGSETILVVEDNPATRLAVADTLEGLGYRVLTAANGEQALALYAEQGDAIDLVLSDLVMPGMDGLELYQALRQRQAGVKFLIMTGHPLGGVEADRLLRGVVAWMQKPFAAGDLVARVRGMLDAAD